MISAYIARYRKSLEALPGGPYPGADPAQAAELDVALEALASGTPIQGDEGNGLFAYLRAVAAIRAGDPLRAVDEVREGNAAPRFELVVAQNPISTACPALEVMNELGRHVEALIEADPTVAGDLYDTSLRIARAEPRSTINLLIGAAFVNSALKADAMAARESNDVGRIRAATLSADRHRDWMTSIFKAVMGSRIFGVLDQMRFNRLVGLSSADSGAYFEGNLSDPAKIAAFESAADLAYRKERGKVERLLRKLPNG
jgi:hypothetical protein